MTRPIPPCGTTAAYHRHRRRGTDYLVEYNLGPVRYVAVAMNAREET